MKNIYKLLFVSIFSAQCFMYLHAQQCDVLYVTPTGASSGNAGTRANPASFIYAMSLVNATANHIWMAQGTYNVSNAIQLVSNLTIEGGFDAATWEKSNATPTIIQRDNQNLLPSPANALGAFAGLNISGFRLQDLTINVADAPGNGNSVYGIYLSGCSNYNIVRCNVTTGAGAPGTNGVAGSVGAAGSPGGNGTNGNPNEVIQPGGAGGAGGFNGGNGASNGRHGTSNAPGQTGGGGAGCGGAGGASGTGPPCNLGCFGGSPNCNSATPGQVGQPGGNGAAGATGAAGAAGTVSGLGYFVPGAAGGNGAAGGGGCGGGGGGGGGGRQNNGQDDVGGGGGGGGGGGFGGGGGTGGTGGGGSFAVFLFNNGAGGNIVDCSLNAGAGGIGGIGGTGGTGGAGAAGGNGGSAGCGNSAGGRGGNGGIGGAGGTGGNGANGPSTNLSQNGGTPVTQSNITSVPGNPPVIRVSNFGCTNAEVVFNSTTSGAWNFGTGASPATANGSGPISVFYTTNGRKTIGFAGTNFTDFVDIFNAQSNSNTITHTNIPAVSGCADTFRTTINGSLYEWQFGNTSIPSSTTGATFQSAPTVFTVAGTYTVNVFVTTACCGRVKDSIVLNVQPNALNITLTPSADTICQGGTITYTATPANYQRYDFLVNNVIVQTSSANSYNASSLAPGDSVTVLGYNGVCYTNPSSVHHPVITPIPVVTISSSNANDTICSGTSITFTALPTGFQTYNFSNSGTSVQSSSSNTYTTTSLTSPNSISVVATQNGCSSAHSNAITTFVIQTPVITIASSANPICAGDYATITASPAGIGNYDFILNGSSVQNSASNTFSSSSFVNGDVIRVIGSNLGCIGNPSADITMTVNPIPVVILTSSDADNSICQADAVTFTATPAGLNSYEFYDGNSLLQNSAANTYTTSALINGSSITVVAVNLNCQSVASAPIVTAVQPAPVVNAGTDQSACIDAGVQQLSGFTPAGGLWSGSGISNASTGIFDPAVSGAGNITLTYTFTDPITGCGGTDNMVFTVNQLPVIILPSAYQICEGQSTTLNATGGTTYLWSPASNLSSTIVNNPIANPTTTTNYSVTVTDANNCSNTSATTLTVNPNPIANFSTNVVCNGFPTSFTNSSSPISASYLWSFGDGNSSTSPTPNHTYTNSGNFTATLVATLGTCSDTLQNQVIVYPSAIADFVALPTVQYVGSSTAIQFNNLSQYADSYMWNLGDGTQSNAIAPSHTYLQAGVYTITLVSSNQYGCSDTLTRKDYISVYETPHVFVPNAFTPNGDGTNDLLLSYPTNTKFFEWQIFDRWGEKVFQTNNYLLGWDGDFRGKPSPAGVYTYVLSIVFNDDSSRKLKGTVMLIR